MPKAAVMFSKCRGTRRVHSCRILMTANVIAAGLFLAVEALI